MKSTACVHFASHHAHRNIASADTGGGDKHAFGVDGARVRATGRCSIDDARGGNERRRNGGGESATSHRLARSKRVGGVVGASSMVASVEMTVGGECSDVVDDTRALSPNRLRCRELGPWAWQSKQDRRQSTVMASPIDLSDV